VSVRVAWPFGPTVVGLTVPASPLEVVIVSTTLLLKPLMGPTVMVEVPGVPAGTIRLDGLAEIVKSG
jgi:hypothetical protein